jgi:aryl-alcohol dehydrogenase-like predicted oxidoreductase
MTDPERVRFGGGEVGRIGFGAMQLPGPGVFGPPRDRDAALAVLRRAVELGVNHIDTAQYYGPDVANELIRAALSPYPADLLIVTKVGARRDAAGNWLDAGAPAELRAGVEANIRSLGIEPLPVVNLRVINQAADALFDDQLAMMVELRDAGLVAAIGISNVSAEQLARAADEVAVAGVQNAFNAVDQSAAPIVAECARLGIPFVAYFPLGSRMYGAGHLRDDQGILAVAERLGVTATQVALAWLLGFSSSILLIPGTSSIAHLEENLAAADVVLDETAWRDLGGPAG